MISSRGTVANVLLNINYTWSNFVIPWRHIKLRDQHWSVTLEALDIGDPKFDLMILYVVGPAISLQAVVDRRRKDNLFRWRFTLIA